MTSGPFQGMNAPGSSAMGSKNPQEMAQKWNEKYGGMDYKTEKMQAKQKDIRDIATGNTGHPSNYNKAAGGIMRLGYAQGNPHQDQQDVQGPAHLSHNAPVDQGPAHLSHNAPPGGPSGGGDGKGITSQIGPTLDKGANILQNILPFMDPKKANMFGLGLNLFRTLRNKDKVTEEDMTYGVGDQATGPGNYSQNEVAGQLFGTSFGVLDPFQQGQVNDAINTYGTTSLGTIKT